MRVDKVNSPRTGVGKRRDELTYPGGKSCAFMSRRRSEPARAVTPDEQQAHYLLHVMRAKASDRITLFNGRDGEWAVHVASRNQTHLPRTRM